MQEKLKLKYLKLCKNEDVFYQIMNDWNIYLIKNKIASKEEKVQKLASIKEIEPHLYQIMLEDIYEGTL